MEGPNDKDIEIMFCENDDNMLYMKLDDDKNFIYYCKLCGKEYPPENKLKKSKCVYYQEYNNNTNFIDTNLNPNIYNDPTIPYAKNVKCINVDCESHKTDNHKIKFIKYNKDDMKFIYYCCVCKKTSWYND
tara:strand:- start:22 stop:414 length:393 start_codon:yes stop_codon:yes gene_type:complete